MWNSFAIVASLIVTEIIPFAAIASRPDLFLKFNKGSLSLVVDPLLEENQENNIN